MARRVTEKGRALKPLHELGTRKVHGTVHHMCQGRSTPFLGDGKNPNFNDGNPHNGYIKPYGIVLMSLSPTTGHWEFGPQGIHIPKCSMCGRFTRIPGNSASL